jgi:hypothetical protein
MSGQEFRVEMVIQAQDFSPHPAPTNRKEFKPRAKEIKGRETDENEFGSLFPHPRTCWHVNALLQRSCFW